MATKKLTPAPALADMDHAHVFRDGEFVGAAFPHGAPPESGAIVASRLGFDDKGQPIRALSIDTTHCRCRLPAEWESDAAFEVRRAGWAKLRRARDPERLNHAATEYLEAMKQLGRRVTARALVDELGLASTRQVFELPAWRRYQVWRRKPGKRIVERAFGGMAGQFASGSVVGAIPKQRRRRSRRPASKPAE